MECVFDRAYAKGSVGAEPNRVVVGVHWVRGGKICVAAEYGDGRGHPCHGERQEPAHRGGKRQLDETVLRRWTVPRTGTRVRVPVLAYQSLIRLKTAEYVSEWPR